MFTLNNKRINIFAPYTAPDGTHGIDLTKAENRVKYGVVEIADPLPPEDFSDELYYRTEQDEAPYVVYTRKSDEQIAEMQKAKALAEIARLEEIHLRQSLRAIRERELEAQEAYALEHLGMTPEQLYVAASQPGAPVAMISYKRLKDIDNAVKQERNKL